MQIDHHETATWCVQKFVDLPAYFLGTFTPTTSGTAPWHPTSSWSDLFECGLWFGSTQGPMIWFGRKAANFSWPVASRASPFGCFGCLRGGVSLFTSASEISKVICAALYYWFETDNPDMIYCPALVSDVSCIWQVLLVCRFELCLFLCQDDEFKKDDACWNRFHSIPAAMWDAQCHLVNFIWLLDQTDHQMAHTTGQVLLRFELFRRVPIGRSTLPGWSLCWWLHPGSFRPFPRL